MSSWFSELYLNKNRKSLSNDFDINGNTFINHNNNNVNNMRNYSNNNNNKKKCTNNDKTTCDSKDSGGDQESESSETESSEESEDEEDEEESGSYSSSSESDDDENKCENNNSKKGKGVIKLVNSNKYKECCQTGLLKVNNNSYSVIFNSKSEDGYGTKHYSVPKTKGLPYLK